MTLTIFPASQLGGDNDLLSQARSGAVDFVQPAGLILASILPVAAVNGMGFAFKDYAQVWTAIDGDLGDYVRAQIAAKAGLVPMEKRWDLGFRQITTSAKPIEKAADLAGLKLRVPGAPALVSLFTALGASPVSMQFGEVYTSLQTRIVDGQENPLSVIDAGKFYEVQKYCADHQPRLGRLLDLRQSRFLEPAAERHQGDRREGVQRNRAAGTRRPQQARPLAAGRTREEGRHVHQARPRHRSATSCARRGFYQEWRAARSATRRGRFWRSTSGKLA